MKTSVDAVEDIVITHEYIVNDTSFEWLDFHMYLMVDIFNPQAGFDDNYIPDGDQFEDLHYAINYGYNSMPIQLNFEDTDANGVPPDPPGQDVFNPGLTIGQVMIATDPGMQIGTRFGLKEVPTPEPTTLILLGMGSLIAVNRRKKTIA